MGTWIPPVSLGRGTSSFLQSTCRLESEPKKDPGRGDAKGGKGKVPPRLQPAFLSEAPGHRSTQPLPPPSALLPSAARERISQQKWDYVSLPPDALRIKCKALILTSQALVPHALLPQSRLSSSS